MKRTATLTLALITMLVMFTACGNKTYKTYWFDFTVDSAKTIDSYTGLELDEGFKFIDVEITTKNTSGGDLAMFDWDYYVIWGEGDYDYNYCYDPIDDYMCPSEVVLADKESMTQHYIFQVPEDAKDLQICFWEQFEGGEYGEAYFSAFKVD